MGRLFVVIKEMLLLYFSPKLLLCLSTFLLFANRVGNLFLSNGRVQFSLLDICGCRNLCLDMAVYV